MRRTDDDPTGLSEEQNLTGLESLGGGLAARAGISLVSQWAKSSDYERLCEHLAERFGEQTGFSAAFFLDWRRDETFMAVLAPLLIPPHHFDRRGLIAAITPLVGPIDQHSSAEEFAAEIADAIREDIRVAKSGDELIRYETDRVLQASRAPQGILEFDWAPSRALSGLRRLAKDDAPGARSLEEAFAGRELKTELARQIGSPQAWLRDGSAALWDVVAELAEVLGLWPRAQAAWEEYAERSGADRVRGLIAAAQAADICGDAEVARRLRDQAAGIDPDHELLRLTETLETEDPATRLDALEEMPEPEGERSTSRFKAVLAITLTDLGRTAEARKLAEEALAADPDNFRAREAIAASILAANIERKKRGKAPDRTQLGLAAEHYRYLLDAMRESGRNQEAGGLRGMLGQCELLAGRGEETRRLIEEREAEEMLGEVPLELAGLALAAGAAEEVDELLAVYEGDSSGADLLRARADLVSGEPDRAIASLEKGVADGEEEFAAMRLMAAIEPSVAAPWSTEAEDVLQATNPVFASQLKADWHDQRGEAEAARRVLARHADDPRAVRGLMMQYADRQDWRKAAPQARRLLELDPDLDVRLGAGQALRHAGEEAAAEEALRGVFDHPEVRGEEQKAAFDELADLLLRARRFDDAGRLADLAAEDGLDRAVWLKGHALALSGNTADAFDLLGDEDPTTEIDRSLLANLVFSHEPPRPALGRLIELADEAAEPDEEIEVMIVRCLTRCKPEELNEDLVRRASPMQFVERFPESEYLWKEKAPEGEAELREKLRELTRGRAQAIASAEKHVFEDGDWPVGALATAIGRSLAETWGVLSSLPIRYRGGERDAEEIETVRSAAGVPVVVETSALCVLDALPKDTVETILAEFPHSARPDAVTADLLQTMPEGRDDEEKGMTVGWDLDTEQPVVQEMSPDQAALPGLRARAMLALAQRLKVAPGAVPQREGKLGVAEVYLEVAVLAQEDGRAVYTDDRCLRENLAAKGIESFGTIAVLSHLKETGAITTEEHHQARTSLIERGAFDLEM